MILCNFEHLAEISPSRASHAIYVRSGAVQAVPAVGEVPSILLRRMLSVRGFGADHCIKTAEVIEGRTLSATIEAFFSKTVISYPQRSTRLFRGKSAAWLMHSNACKLHNAVWWVWRG